MDMLAYAEAISKNGTPKANILLLENGQIAKFSNTNFVDDKTFLELAPQPINLQGNLDSGASSMMERKQMQTSGAVLVSYVIDKNQKKLTK
jgi:mRNA degradation ribonuclease J1/J2